MPFLFLYFLHCIHHIFVFIDATKTRVNVEKETVADNSQFYSRRFSLTSPANCDNIDNQSNSTIRQKSLLKPVDLLTRPSISNIEQISLLSSLVGKYHVVQCVIASVLKIFC